jgi:hypothetical protein
MMKLQLMKQFSIKRLIIGVCLIAVILLIVNNLGDWKTQAQKNAPRLGLITTLPLQWSEGDFSENLNATAEPLPAYATLSKNYQITLIDAVTPQSLKGINVLFLAQSRAMSPAELVVLDQWVRSGGRVLILADPALAWESLFPLGDQRRPLFTSLLSPLFAHWGVELVLPMDDASEKIVIKKAGDFSIRTISPGEWVPVKGDGPRLCTIEGRGLTAICRVGAGRAILVADADMLDEQYWQGSGIRQLSGDDDFDNMNLVMKALNDLLGKQAT